MKVSQVIGVILAVLLAVPSHSYASDTTRSADPDVDDDGVMNIIDNCPTIANPRQQDWDENGVGDVCEPTRQATRSMRPD